MIKIDQILTGWANLIKDNFNKLDHDIKKISEERLFVCNDCDIRLGNVCDPRKIGNHVLTGELKRGCGCNIAAKSLAKNSKCPLGKW